MNQQTAIEWLMTQLPRGLVEGFKDAFEQAKQVEKERIEEAFYASGKYGIKFASTYYEETYGK